MTTFSPDIAEKIRNLVIFEGLELEELGIELDDIKDDTLLYDADGLDLDSIDALGVQVRQSRGAKRRLCIVDFINAMPRAAINCARSASAGNVSDSETAGLHDLNRRQIYLLTTYRPFLQVRKRDLVQGQEHRLRPTALWRPAWPETNNRRGGPHHGVRGSNKMRVYRR